MTTNKTDEEMARTAIWVALGILLWIILVLFGSCRESDSSYSNYNNYNDNEFQRASKNLADIADYTRESAEAKQRTNIAKYNRY